jgi:hypothetical protein
MSHGLDTLLVCPIDFCQFRRNGVALLLAGGDEADAVLESVE